MIIKLNQCSIETLETMIAELCQEEELPEDVSIDISKIEFFRPCDIVPLISRIQYLRYRDDIKSIELQLPSKICCAYLSRIGFFQLLGVEYKETFFLRLSRMRFLPITL